MSENRTQTDENTQKTGKVRESDPDHNTTRLIVSELRVYGPHLKVLHVSRNRAIQEIALNGAEGLLTKYPKDFSSADPRRQLTHRDGGVIHMTLFENLGKAVMMGMRFGMVVFENCDFTSSSAEGMRDDVLHTLLTSTPRMWVISEDGQHDHFDCITG
jgi:hypothetical protein